jgi:putative hydrolase of the HAD superfamily
MNTEKYEHIFFDLDHTIWDFETNSALALQVLMTKFNFDEKGFDRNKFIARYSYYNSKLWEQLEKGLVTRAEVKVNRFLFTLNEFNCNDFELAKALDHEYLQLLPLQNYLFDDAIEVLDFLFPKYQLHIITNGFLEVQTQKLKNSNLDKYFCEVITSEEANANKPNIEIFNFAFARTKATALNSVMIGDNPFADMQGALNVGMDRILYNTMKHEHQIPVTKEISSLKELIHFL